MQIHVVESGDSIWEIVQMYYTDMNQVIFANGLSDANVLVVGQALVIPELGMEYVVVPGDDLGTIAARYGVTVQELAEVNNITNPALIYVGQVLQLPYSIHAVQVGESLYMIARRYGVTVNQLVEANTIENINLISPGQLIRIPTAFRPVIDVNAYITQMNEEGRQDALFLGKNFTYLSPFSYEVGTDGSITSLQDEAIIQAALATNTEPWMVITNTVEQSFDSDLTQALFQDEEAQDTLITNVLNVMQDSGYTGLNVNFEYVYAEDRENYNNFLRNVVARLHQQGYAVSTAVAPKTSAEQTGTLYEGHDYAAHGEIVDFVIVMTYEWGWAGGPPMAISPVNQMRGVLDYAVTAIPREKILMGFSLYGREWDIPWQDGTTASTLSPQEAVNRAAQYNAEIQYDETSQAPFYRYTDENGQRHEVWFEDARSVGARYNLVEEYNLRGVSYWQLGFPFPQNWLVLNDMFTVRKQ